MKIDLNKNFCEYFEEWIKIYKEGAVRAVTLKKYHMALTWLRKIVPDLKISELDRSKYQEIINAYAVYHERQTTMDFHHQIKAAVLDAVDDGYIDRDPTRKVIIKGKLASAKKPKLNIPDKFPSAVRRYGNHFLDSLLCILNHNFYRNICKGCYAPQMRQGLDKYSHRNGTVIKHKKGDFRVPEL